MPFNEKTNPSPKADTLPCTLIFMAENVLLKLDGQVATPVYNNISKVNHHKSLAYEEGITSFAAHLR